MPPNTTSTWSSWISFVATASAAASSVSLSSRWSSMCRPNRPPRALMSSITMRATFAPATPMNERAPVWSVITPTLIGSGVIAPAELGDLRGSLVPGLLHDRRDLRVRGEGLPALGVPVEDHPHAIVLVGVPEDDCALGPMLTPFVGALGRENRFELVEVSDGGCCQKHVLSSY